MNRQQTKTQTKERKEENPHFWAISSGGSNQLSEQCAGVFARLRIVDSFTLAYAASSSRLCLIPLSEVDHQFPAARAPDVGPRPKVRRAHSGQLSLRAFLSPQRALAPTIRCLQRTRAPSLFPAFARIQNPAGKRETQPRDTKRRRSRLPLTRTAAGRPRAASLRRGSATSRSRLCKKPVVWLLRDKCRHSAT